MNVGTGWPKGWNPGGEKSVECVEASGVRALKVSEAKPGKKSWWIQYNGNLKAGRKYEFTVRVKGTPGTSGMAYAECNNPWKTVSTKFVCSEKWETISFELKFDKLNVPPYIVLRQDSPGEVLFTNPSLAEVTSSNVLRNPGFKMTAPDGFPAEWTKPKETDAKRVEVSEGKYALRLSNDDAKRKIVIHHGTAVEKGVEYVFTVKYRGKPGTAGLFYIECNKPWKSFASHLNCKEDWQTASLKFRYIDMNALPYAVLAIQGKGEIEFAEPSIEPVKGSFTNGDFNGGSVSWKLENAEIVNTSESNGNVLQLNGTEAQTNAIQKGILLRKDTLYKLSYQVRGGSDKRYTDSQGATWFRVAPFYNGKPLPGTEGWRDSFSSWQNKELTFTAPSDMEAEIVCSLRDKGTVQFDNIAIVEAKSPILPLEVVLDAPYSYRNGIISGNAETRFSGKVFMKLPNVKKLSLEFNGTAQSLEPAKDKTASFELPIPAKTGRYPLLVRACNAEGKEVDRTSLDFTVYPKGKREITFRKDHVMLIDGEPFFPLGVWTVNGNKPMSEKMRIAAEAGFNIAMCDGDQIDDAADAGLLAMLKIMEKLPEFKTREQFDRWDNAYRKELARLGTHPSLVAYFITDEPAWGGRPALPIQKAYRYVAELDPYRPILLNEAPRGKPEDLRSYAAACDAWGVDIYPVPGPNPHSELDDKMMTSVGKYTDICRETVRDAKPVWMTLQAFAWGVLTKRPPVYPAHEENRFMAYNAIAHGATGLFYWGINTNGVENWPFVAELGRTIRELRSISGFLVGETIRKELSADAPEICILHKRAGNKNCYILLNESGKNLEAKISGKLPAKLFVLNENRTVSPENGMFADRFAPYSVHVYTDSETLPPPAKQPKTRRIFGAPFQSSESFRQADWIWFPGKHKTPGSTAFFRHEFDLASVPENAELAVAADDFFRCLVNSGEVMNGGGYDKAQTLDIAKNLKAGKNVLFLECKDGGTAPCGVLFALRLQGKDGKVSTLCSGSSIQSSEDGGTGWQNAEVIGKFGCQPWDYRTRAVPYKKPAE